MGDAGILSPGRWHIQRNAGKILIFTMVWDLIKTDALTNFNINLKLLESIGILNGIPYLSYAELQEFIEVHRENSRNFCLKAEPSPGRFGSFPALVITIANLEVLSGVCPTVL